MLHGFVKFIFQVQLVKEMTLPIYWRAGRGTQLCSSKSPFGNGAVSVL